MNDLKNKVAIVTGARRGMGRTHVLALAKAGAKVVVSDIDQNDCEKVAQEVKESGGEAIAIKCDVTKEDEVEAMVQETVSKWGSVDILVNNAGIAQMKPFLELTEEDWDRTLDINLKGYFLCAKACAKIMVKQKSGVIVNIASVAMGQQGIGFPTLTHYSASKGGIVAMTEALALELAPYNIRVNAIAPGLIETAMIDPIKQDKDLWKAMLSRVPMRRAGKPEEISNLVLFLASDASSYITGSVIVADGGWLSS